MIELYAIKPFLLGSFLTWYLMRKWNKYNNDPKTYEIKEI